MIRQGNKLMMSGVIIGFQIKLNKIEKYHAGVLFVFRCLPTPRKQGLLIMIFTVNSNDCFC